MSLLGRLHHRNLVNLVGYCVDKGQRMLIYEFMTNGSLASLLYGKFVSPFPPIHLTMVRYQNTCKEHAIYELVLDITVVFEVPSHGHK